MNYIIGFTTVIILMALVIAKIIEIILGRKTERVSEGASITEDKTVSVVTHEEIEKFISEQEKREAVSERVYVLGTIIQLRAFGEKSGEAVKEAVKRLYEIDDRMSVFKNYSDVSRINMSAGVCHEKVNEDTYFVIKRAVYYAQLSHGAFEPTIRPLLNLYGFGSKNQRVPEKEALQEALKLVNYKDIILNDKDKSVMLRYKDQSLDLGAIAKGYAADEVKGIFLENEVISGIIDLGGNIYAVGKKSDDSLWNVGIQDPLKSTGNYMAVVHVADKSIVTSGNYERFFESNGKRYHHIINPKTGYPCENKIISTTIISDKSIDGDGLTTCCYILGLQEGLDLIERTEGADGIVITEDKKVYITSGIKSRITLANHEYAFS